MTKGITTRRQRERIANSKSRNRVAATRKTSAKRSAAIEALQVPVDLLRAMFDRTLDAILVADDQARFIGANPAACELLGYSRDEFLRMSIWDITPAQNREDGLARWHKFIATGTLSGEYVVLRKNGATRVTEFRAVASLLPGFHLSVMRDITERKRAGEEIKRHAMHAEVLARTASRLNRQLDLDAVIKAVCQEALDTFRVSQTAMSLYDERRDLLVYAGGINIPPEEVAIMEPISRAQYEEIVRTMGPIVVVPDIQSVPGLPNAELNVRQDIRTIVTAIMLRDQELVGTLTLGVKGHVQQFTQDELTLLKALSDQAAQAIANALLLKAANEHREQLRALTSRTESAVEAERRRLARELHDEIGQALTAVKINLQTAKLNTTEAMGKRLDEDIGIVDKVLQQVRNLSFDLRPALLDDLGLVPALRWYVDRIAQRSGLSTEFTAHNAEARWPSNVETACFRIAQEALANVQWHAHAKRVRVELSQREGELQLAIQDDGIGFDVQAAFEQAASGMSLGLLGMQERVELAGGQLEIESASTHGTQIRARFPLAARSQDPRVTKRAVAK